MDKMSKFNLAFRLVLIGLLLLFYGVSAYAIFTIMSNTPEDYIFSLVVISVALLFATFELVMNLLHIKRSLSILKIGITERGQINPIPMIAIVASLALALGVTTFGLVMYFVKNELVIKCNALVITSIGFFLLINCVFYLIVILLAKKKLS